MKNINVVLVFLCIFHVISGMVVTKGTGPVPENDEDRATTSIPEPSNVRTEKPDTDSVNDVAKPQLPNVIEQELLLSDSPLIKRCARSEVVGSSHQVPTLSIARRDVNGRRIQQCETCRNSKLCKEHNVCAHCKNLCKVVSTTPLTPIETTPSPEKREVTTTPVPEKSPQDNVILGSRFAETDNSNTIPRYYSVGNVESEPALRLFTKIFNIPDTFEKFIVLGKMRGSTELTNFNNIVIIDLAQVFGSDKKTLVTLHRFENSDPNNVRLVNELNKKLDEILNEKKKTGEQLGVGEIDEVIDEAMKEVSNNVGKPQEEGESTRCNLDEAVDDLIAVLPANMAEQAKTSLHHDQPPHQQPHHELPYHEPQPQIEESRESSEEEIKNPPVIQDNFSVGEPQKKADVVNDYVDDTEESKAAVPGTSSRLQENTNDDHTKDNMVGVTSETEPLPEDVGNSVGERGREELPEENMVRDILDNNQPIPSSENQVVGDQAQPSNDLESNVLKIVEESLKAASDGQNMLRNGNQVGQENPTSQANTRDMQTVMKPLEDATAEELPTHQEVPEPVVTDAPNNVGITQIDVESRSQFEDGEKSNYFGSLVPSKDLSGVTDPRMKKVLYVGENMNLPLKMFQDKDGVIKLRVDTDALCNCKNTTCTKKHVDDRFRSAVTEDQETELPPLQVRYGRDNQRSRLMESFMDSLHNHDENLGIFKRSAENNEVVDNDKMEIENEIEKLSEDLQRYKNAKKELLNKGTVGLFKDVEKTRDTDKMITLANNFLIWMRELVMKRLDS